MLDIVETRMSIEKQKNKYDISCFDFIAASMQGWIQTKSEGGAVDHGGATGATQAV